MMRPRLCRCDATKMTTTETPMGRTFTVNCTRYVALLLVLLAPATLSAQGSGDSTRLGDLVVTATRIPTNASELSTATTVIRGDDLRARGVQLVLDALREVPGMMVVQAGSYGAQTSVFLRGGESDYVKVLLDGVPLNQPGGSINFANLTTADLDRIEIVRGPASVLYGADAMTGVIQLFTRKATATPIAELSVRGGTFASSDVNGHLSFVSREWSVSATGLHEATDGSYMFNSGFTNSVASLRLGYDGGSSGRAVFTLRYGDGVAHFPTDGGGNPIDHNQFTTETTLAMGLDVSWATSKNGTATLHGFGSRLDEGYTNRMDSPADTSGFDFIDDRTGITWRKGFDARLDQHVRGSVISLGAGLENETDNEHEIGVSNFGTGPSPDTTASTDDRTTRNAFVQLLSEPGASVSTQLGFRVDDNSAFGTFGTWRIGATWHAGTDTRVWVAAGTAFKAPTFPQLFASSAFEVGNPALKPETSRNTEFGIERTTDDHHLTASVTAFWQEFRDLIQYVSAAPGQPTYVNLGGADAHGVELNLVARLSTSFSINGHWSWLTTEVTDTGSASSLTFEQGASLIRRPGSSGGGTAEYHQRGFTVAATITRIGTRDDVDFSSLAGARVTLPAYTTVDLSVDAPIRRSTGRSLGIDLMLRGENLFNAAYVQTVGFPGRSRALFAGASARF
jgi:vitamin B12 transporter